MASRFINKFSKWYESCEVPEGTYSGARALLFPPDFVLSWLGHRSYRMYHLWDKWADLSKVAYPKHPQREASTPELFTCDKAVVDQLRADGVASIPNAFSQPWLEEARAYILDRFERTRAKAETMTKDPEENLAWLDDDGIYVDCIRDQGRYQFDFPHDPELIRKLPQFIIDFMRLPVTHSVIEEYYGMAVTPCRPYAHAEVTIPGRRVGPWHIDCSRRGVKAMLYLNDIGPAQAPFRYQVGSHIPDDASHRHIYRIGRSGIDHANFDEETNAFFDANATIFTRPENTLLLFDNRGAHAGSLCTEGMRITLVNGFRPATSTRINPRFFPPLPLDNN